MTSNPLTRTLLSAAALSISAILFTGTHAFADASPATSSQVQQDVSAAVSSQGVSPAAAVATSDGSFSSHENGNVVDIPRDSSDPATIANGGVSIAVDLPSDDPAGTRVGSTIVYEGEAGSSAVAVQAIPDGLRAFVTIDDSSAAHSYPFPLSGDVARVDEDTDGGLILYDAAGAEIGSVGVPWATDANGASVPTHFNVVGTTVTQVVEFETDTAFPVVADPAVHLHWTTFTVELYPKDQRVLAAGAIAVGVPAIVAAVCSPLPVTEPVCAGAGRGLAATLATYVALSFHPHCHLNLSFYYVPFHFDRWWTSQCS